MLDFIGGANRRFPFDLRYRALVGGTRRSVERAIDQGFTSLPSGCVIQLDRRAQASGLANVKSQLGVGVRALVEDLRSLGSGVDLATFLSEAGGDLEDVYANERCWTVLRRMAGFTGAAERAHGAARGLGAPRARDLRARRNPHRVRSAQRARRREAHPDRRVPLRRRGD